MLSNFLAKHDFQAVQQQVEHVSWELLHASIAERFQGTRTIFTERELWSKYVSVLDNYPVILGTTHSIKTSLSPDCLYDLLIVDEASQVDVATGVLALSCARRAVIVGDEKQLPNIIDGNSRQLATEIWTKYQSTCQAWNYACNSLLSSVSSLWPQAPNVMLREHYRCHPMIAGFLNRKFYDDQLIITTADLGLPERERQFATNPWSHVDLLIYDTIGKLPLVGVEVDGWAFHRPGSLQSVRDEIKKNIFELACLRLVRLSTTGSGESAVISRALREAVGLVPN